MNTGSLHSSYFYYYLTQISGINDFFYVLYNIVGEGFINVFHNPFPDFLKEIIIKGFKVFSHDVNDNSNQVSNIQVQTNKDKL